jgi:hypothetical protein
MPSGWVQFPFYASRNADPSVYPEWDYTGFSANSFEQGAIGVVGIPTPPDASRVLKVRVAGKIVKGGIEVTLTRSRLGGSNQQLLLKSITSDKPQDFDEQEPIPGKLRGITKDDTLSLTIQAQEGAGHQTHVRLVAVQFQRSASY